MCWHIKPYTRSWRRIIKESEKARLFCFWTQVMAKWDDNSSIFKTSFVRWVNSSGSPSFLLANFARSLSTIWHYTVTYADDWRQPCPRLLTLISQFFSTFSLLTKLLHPCKLSWWQGWLIYTHIIPLIKMMVCTMSNSWLGS